MDYLRTLCYKQRPDYCGIESAFIQMMDAREVNIDEPMDWEPVYIKRPGEVISRRKKYLIFYSIFRKANQKLCELGKRRK